MVLRAQKGLQIQCVNTWAGHEHEAINEWIKAQALIPGILLCQEVHRSVRKQPSPYFRTEGSHRKEPVYLNLYEDLCQALPGWYARYKPHLNGICDLGPRMEGVQYGNALFVHPSIKVVGYHSGMAFGRFDQYKSVDEVTEKHISAARSMQAVVVERNGVPYIAVHFHGLWTGNGKGDTPERTKQSERVSRFIRNLTQLYMRRYEKNPCVILCGDFNLHGETQALEILRKSLSTSEREAVNLNKLYGITNTRTHLYPEDKARRTGFEADWMMVSPWVVALLFEVLHEPVISDHCILRALIA